MFNKLSNGMPVIMLVILMAILFVAGQANAQTKVSGKMTIAYTKSDSIEIPDVANHTTVFSEAKGTNTSTGENAFMEGAETTVASYVDFVMGNGPNQGYSIFKMGDDMVVAKWKGDVKTTMTEEGAPNVTFVGTYEYIKGAGQFENIAGGGTYKGHFTSNTEYVAEWQGEYTLK